MSHIPPVTINTFSRPSTPRMQQLKQHVLSTAATIGQSETDVWEAGKQKAIELYSNDPAILQPETKAPSLIDIRKAVSSHFNQVFPGAEPLYGKQIDISIPPITRPHATSSKRSNSDAGSSAKRRRTLTEEEQERGRSTIKSNRDSRDPSILRAFSPFSKQNLHKTSAVAIADFNETRPENQKLLQGSQDYNRAMQRHALHRKNQKP